MPVFAVALLMAEISPDCPVAEILIVLVAPAAEPLPSVKSKLPPAPPLTFSTTLVVACAETLVWLDRALIDDAIVAADSFFVTVAFAEPFEPLMVSAPAVNAEPVLLAVAEPVALNNLPAPLAAPSVFSPMLLAAVLPTDRSIV
jgi:hypothetical protein